MTRSGMKIRQESQTRQTDASKAIKDTRRAPRKQYSAEEKMRILLDGLRGEETIAVLCRCEGIAQSIFTNGRRRFSKLANDDLPEIRPVRLRLMRWPLFTVKRVN